MASFSAQLKTAIARNEATLEKARILLIQRLFRDITFDTPVLDGFLRGSWKATTESPEYTLGAADPSGSTTIQQINTTVGASNFKTTVYLTNGQPYGYRIEFEGWSAVKAPEGMVRRNVLRVQEILKQVQREVNRG